MSATKKPKTRTVAVRGIVERCDLKDRPPYDPYIGRYDPLPTERKDYYLDVCVRLPDGSAVYFKTPGTARMTCSCCPGAAVVTYRIDGSAGDWLEEIDGSGVATAERANTNGIRPKVKVGDTITVAGRVKADTVSKWGKTYKTLTHVFVPTPEGLANFDPADKIGV